MTTIHNSDNDLLKGMLERFITGKWTVEPSRNLIARGFAEIHIEPRVMDALVHLASRKGQVVSKEELVTAVWDGRYVTDEVLTVTIYALRKALNDDARKPEYIETVPRRGYRWIANVTRITPEPATHDAALTSSPDQNHTVPNVERDGGSSTIWRGVAMGFAVLVVLAASLWSFLPLPGKRHVALTEAHEAYIKGRFFLDQRSIQGWRQALEQFQRATSLDPQDPAAQAGLADTYSAMSDFGVASPAEMRPRAFQCAQRALQLDRNSAEGYEALARAQFLFDWDFQAAEHSLNKALSINFDYMPAHQTMAWLKLAEGQYTNAASAARIALQLDPVNTARYTELAWVLALGGRYGEAEHEIERALALNPRSFEAYLAKGWISDLAGDSTAAFQAYHDGLQAAGVPSDVLKHIEGIYRTQGLPGYYRNLLNIQRRGSKMPMSNTFRAQLYVRAGELNQALQSLQEAYERREGALAWVNVEPSFKPLRSEPEFKVIADRVGKGLAISR